MGRKRKGMKDSTLITAIQDILISNEFVWPQIDKLERCYFVKPSLDFYDVTTLSEPYKCRCDLSKYRPRNGCILHNHINVADNVPSVEDYGVLFTFPNLLHALVLPDFTIIHYWIDYNGPQLKIYSCRQKKICSIKRS